MRSTTVFSWFVAAAVGGATAFAADPASPPGQPGGSGAPAGGAVGVPAEAFDPMAAPTAATPQPGAPDRPADYKKFRDPFKEPIISEIADTRSELEKFAVTEFRVTGIVTGPLRMRAMIIAPDGKTHYVSEKMKMGLRDGVIAKITTRTVVVREKVVNPLGEVEYFDTEIGLDQPTAAADGKR